MVFRSERRCRCLCGTCFTASAGQRRIKDLITLKSPIKPRSFFLPSPSHSLPFSLSLPLSLFPKCIELNCVQDPRGHCCGSGCAKSPIDSPLAVSAPHAFVIRSSSFSSSASSPSPVPSSSGVETRLHLHPEATRGPHCQPELGPHLRMAFDAAQLAAAQDRAYHRLHLQDRELVACE